MIFLGGILGRFFTFGRKLIQKCHHSEDHDKI